KLFRSVKPWCYDVTLACWEPDQQTNIGCYHCVGVTVVASHPGWHRGCGVLRNAFGAFEMRARSVVKICTTLPHCHTRGNLLIGAFAGPGLCTFESDVSAGDYAQRKEPFNVLSSLDSDRVCACVVRLHNGGAAGLFSGPAQAYNMSFRGRL